MYETHGTECHFIHKRIIGAAGGFITGGVTGAVSGFVRGGGGGPVLAPRPSFGGRASATLRSIQQQVSVGCGAGFVSQGGRCVPMPQQLGLSGRGEGFGSRAVSVGRAVFGATPIGRAFALARGADSSVASFAAPAGDAIMGQWGAALEPAVFSQTRRACIRGMVLGTDGLCYNKPFANNKRMWPRGTKPFLSGGDVKCIRRANTLRRSKGSKKLLRELGFK